VCALHLVVLAAGWHDRLDACLNTDAALSSLLALVGGEVQPRQSNAGVAALQLLLAVKESCGDSARALCSPQVLSGGTMAALTALYAYGKHDRADVHVLAGQLLVSCLGTERAAASAALVRCQHTLAAAAFDVLSKHGADECTSVAVELLCQLMELEHDNGTTWFADALLGPLLPQLKRICSEVAPAELQAWRARFGGAVQRMPMPLQANCMLRVRLVACLASSSRPAAVIKGLLAPLVLAKAVEMQPALFVPEPPRCTLSSATPLSASAVRDLEERHRKQQRALLKADDDADAAYPTDEEAAAAVAERPLLAASRADGLTERERTALARAHAVECHEAYLSRHTAIRLNEWQQIALTGVMNLIISDSPFPFAYTAGLHYMLRGPEMLIVADVADVPAAVLSLLASRLCWRAGKYELDAVSEIGAPHDGALQLITGMQLSERDTQIIPLAFKKLGCAVPEAVAAAAAQIVWRFVPLAQHLVTVLLHDPADDAARAAAESNMICIEGAVNGRMRSVFYSEVAFASEDTQMSIPTLVCSMAESLSTDAGTTVLAALCSLCAGQTAGANPVHGAACICANCKERRACGAACANPACTSQHDPHLLDKLKRCSRCKLVRYCSVSCQRADWGRHKLDCTQS
jgi:hypothetical protein